MTRVLLIAAIAVVLVACGAPTASGGPVSVQPSQELTASPTEEPTPEATAEPTPRPTPAAMPEPESMLGFFDVNSYEQLYDTTFTTDNVTDSTRIRYIAKFEWPLGVDFMIEPSDPTKAIVQSSFNFDSLEATGVEFDLLRTWLDSTERYQPAAVGWLRDRITDYTDAPGAKVSLRQRFGDVCAGFYTLHTSLDPAPDDVATLIGAFVEDATINAC